jgi:membrane protein implicated in regulation of membrane protease activity
MRQFWTYTLARLGLVAVAAGVLWLIGLRGPVLVVLAFVISGLVSFVVLARQRGALARTVESRASRIRDRMAEAEAAEDAADEKARRAAEDS